MEGIGIINQEIDETISSIGKQHEQIKYYFQAYMVALVGLFSISGYFAEDGFTINESVVGATFTITVFILGWIFLSAVSHKVSMIILLYKHMAAFRKKRLEILDMDDIKTLYVLPYEKNAVKMPGMLKFLPYQVFVFNFLIFCGGLAFYLAPHFPYYRTVALVTAGTVFFGSFYPRVCITFNKHISCALRASTLAAKDRMERTWESSIRHNSTPSHLIKIIFVWFSIIGAVSLSVMSFIITSDFSKIVLIIACWIGVTIFALLRYFAEIYNVKVAKRKITELA